ncbi:Rv3235 family protein [Streptomyces sp. NPDC007808]|uniref:Rv3235 family protein n=1 Tax=Streptomyces sp. NPDC007808 TaxID=3364779 RepID=UPI0036C8AE7A
MNKVMTRAAQHRPGNRPPSRRDTRRPGATPPRGPSGGASKAAASAGADRAGTRTPQDALHAPHARPAVAQRVPQPSASRTHAVPSRAPRGPLPPPRPTDVFADRLLLVLSGQRPVHSMLRHTASRAYDELARLAERGPLRARGTRPVVRDIGYFEPRPGAIEAFARIGAGDQLRAMAFRLEQGLDLRWRCTAVELGGRRGPASDGA